MGQLSFQPGKIGEGMRQEHDSRFAFASVLAAVALAASLVTAPSLAFEQAISPAPAPAETSTPEPLDSTRHDVSEHAPISNSSTPKGESSATPKASDNPPVVTEHRPLEESIHGIVTNQVITLVGQDFYNAFVSAWRGTPLSERYNISIYERPSARWGSLVWVEFQHRRLFEAFLPPTRNRIRPIAERAADQAYHNIVQADLDRLLFRDPDLAADEM